MTWSNNGLTKQEEQMLYLERGFFKYAGAKDTQIRELLNMSPTRYYQLLNDLIDKPEAMRWEPLTVKRLQRLRDRRRAVRSSGRMPKG